MNSSMPSICDRLKRKGTARLAHRCTLRMEPKPLQHSNSRSKVNKNALQKHKARTQKCRLHSFSFHSWNTPWDETSEGRLGPEAGCATPECSQVLRLKTLARLARSAS